MDNTFEFHVKDWSASSTTPKLKSFKVWTLKTRETESASMQYSQNESPDFQLHSLPLDLHEGREA